MSLRAQRKTDLQARIVAACGRLFRERGFDETTIADITGAVGISRQTFFNHFSGKDAVLTRLGLDWLREQSTVPRLRARQDPSRSILQGSREAVLAQMRAIEADADFMRVVFTRSGVLFPQAPRADRTGAGRQGADQARALFDNLALVMRAARDAGEIRSDIEPLQVAELYVSTMLMTARLWLVDYWRDGVSLEARAAKALDVLEAGLAQCSGRDREIAPTGSGGRDREIAPTGAASPAMPPEQAE